MNTETSRSGRNEARLRPSSRTSVNVRRDSSARNWLSHFRMKTTFNDRTTESARIRICSHAFTPPINLSLNATTRIPIQASYLLTNPPNPYRASHKSATKQFRKRNYSCQQRDKNRADLISHDPPKCSPGPYAWHILSIKCQSIKTARNLQAPKRLSNYLKLLHPILSEANISDNVPD